MNLHLREADPADHARDGRLGVPVVPLGAAHSARERRHRRSRARARRDRGPRGGRRRLHAHRGGHGPHVAVRRDAGGRLPAAGHRLLAWRRSAGPPTSRSARPSRTPRRPARSHTFAPRTSRSRSAARGTRRARSTRSSRRGSPPTVCWSSRCSRPPAPGRASHRTSTTCWTPPGEVVLEEVYAYRIARPEGFGVQRVYTRDGELDEAYAVHDGDAVLVPTWLPPVRRRARLRLLLPERPRRRRPLDGGLRRSRPRVGPGDVGGARAGPARAARRGCTVTPRIASAPVSFGVFELTAGRDDLPAGSVLAADDGGARLRGQRARAAGLLRRRRGRRRHAGVARARPRRLVPRVATLAPRAHRGTT